MLGSATSPTLWSNLVHTCSWRIGLSLPGAAVARGALPSSNPHEKSCRARGGFGQVLQAPINRSRFVENQASANSTAEISHGMYKMNARNTIISGIASVSLQPQTDLPIHLFVQEVNSLSRYQQARFAWPVLYHQSSGDHSLRVSLACVYALGHINLFQPDVFLLSQQSSVFLGTCHCGSYPAWNLWCFDNTSVN